MAGPKGLRHRTSNACWSPVVLQEAAYRPCTGSPSTRTPKPSIERSLCCRIMRAYMARTGRLGHDMMFRSCTIQTNIDFEDEADMVEKMRIGVALQPIATALFANSPFRGGKPSGEACSGQRAFDRVPSPSGHDQY